MQLFSPAHILAVGIKLHMDRLDNPAAPEATLFRSNLQGLERIHEGKVRDIYAIDDRLMLIVTTDRLSAFDVVLPDPIPSKGRVLTQISNYWFAHTGAIVRNHLADFPLGDAIKNPADLKMLRDRSVVVRRLKALPLEAVVRGYLIGSGWKDYQKTGEVCGIRLPKGLKLASRLPEALFTPASKAPAGEHDENIGLDDVIDRIGKPLAIKVRDTALRLYRFAADHALARGIIIADTKFEFGTDARGQLVLIDEVITPDSSRFWPVESYREGSSPPSFDKQFVRDYLETLDWNKKTPGPHLPADIIAKTSEKYREALRLLTS